MTTASGVAPSVVSGTTPLPPAKTGASGGTLATTADSTLAGNFQTFLTLLTTQLQNQNPLDPLDTNQFTQQLVQFAGVEQQLKTNDQLTSLVSLQQTAQATQALGFVGKTAVVDGATTRLTNGAASWTLGVEQNSNVAITIANSRAPRPPLPAPSRCRDRSASRRRAATAKAARAIPRTDRPGDAAPRPTR